MDLIAIAVPFFLALILAEFIYGIIRGRNTYRLNDTINSLSMGSLSSLSGLMIVGGSALIYEFVVNAFALTQLSADSTLVWIATFIFYDLAYYWKHRLGHEVALFWGSHVSHHQSEDYNLGTALRQTSIDFHGFLFLIPFFIAGVPGEVLVATVSLNLIYQFWVHTQHVPALGPIEWIMVTPSNHRVHHARNDQYVDKNYGGVFIIWDRIFGTYQDELAEEPAVYGLRKPLNSWNPLWANTHVYWRLLVDFVKIKGIKNKTQLLFKRPGWLPEGYAKTCKATPIDLRSKYDPPVAGATKAYVFGQFLITVAVSLSLAGLATLASPVELWAAAGFIVLSLFTHGYVLDKRRLAAPLESARLLLAIALAFLLPLGSMLSALLGFSAAASLIVVGISIALQRNILGAGDQEIRKGGNSEGLAKASV
ncbi:MAG: sterol desaturase family protein [Pseudohongiellaceae bacterium]|jgi:sterol desaturase/sphingolipid hydroxylase (fatty acid hydroxylase superfamily)